MGPLPRWPRGDGLPAGGCQQSGSGCATWLHALDKRTGLEPRWIDLS